LIASHMAQSAAAISAGPLMMPPGRSRFLWCGSSSVHSPCFTLTTRKPYGRRKRDLSSSASAAASLGELDRHRSRLAAADTPARRATAQAVLGQRPRPPEEDAPTGRRGGEA